MRSYFKTANRLYSVYNIMIALQDQYLAVSWKTHDTSIHSTSSYCPITWSAVMGYHWTHISVTSCSHTAFWVVTVTFLLLLILWLYFLFEFYETQHFLRIMHNRKLPIFFGFFLIQKIFGFYLACLFCRSLIQRKRLVASCRALDSSPYASQYCK